MNYKDSLHDSNLNLYFDNAATSWPKPEAVYKSAELQMRNAFGNPGRSGSTRTLEADRLIYKTRLAISKLFNFKDPSRVVFTLNATDALNIALKGFLQQGDHVIHTAMDHNSVLRPLARLHRDGIISKTVIPCSPKGIPDLEALYGAFKRETKLLVINHASNVTGTIAPLEEMVEAAKRNNVFVLVDAAQTAGSYPIDVTESNIDMLAFTGHKSLLGPTGTGGLYVRPGLDLRPLREGGTGSQSEMDSHPESMPERLEAGTLNSTGLAGLLAGLSYLLANGIDVINRQEHEIRRHLHERLSMLPGINIFGPAADEASACIVSFTIDNMDCGEIGYILENNYGIMSRTGLHCAPLMHRSLGTFPTGTVRVSPGPFSNMNDISCLIKAIEEITKL